MLDTYADGTCPNAGYSGPVPYPTRKGVSRIRKGLPALMLPGFYGPPMTVDRFRRLAERTFAWLHNFHRVVTQGRRRGGR